MNSDAYRSDLAYIHDVGYGGFARAAAGLLDLLRRNGITDGAVVDLGCGSGIWAKQLSHAGYQVIGVDISPAMIDLARDKVPGANFYVKSLFEFRFPTCRAVTALGEVFNYLFDATNSLRSLRKVCQHIFDALSPNGILIFDVAEPARSKGVKQAFKEGRDWACLVELEHDISRQRLTRRIVAFRKIGDTYRRQEETHRLQLYEGEKLVHMLRGIGFRVRTVRSYGAYRLQQGMIGFVARKP